MCPTISEIRRWIEAEIADVHVNDTTSDLFFLKGDDGKFPFATIVTSDHEHDSASNLDRDGAFRLNVATDKETFQQLFPFIRGRADLEGASFDYRALDRVFPHPIYGRMRWVSVINPDTSWPAFQDLVIRAGHIRDLRPDSW